MAKEPGRLRKISDFIGITESRAVRESRPVGSRAWWLHMGAYAFVTLLAVMIFQLLF